MVPQLQPARQCAPRLALGVLLPLVFAAVAWAGPQDHACMSCHPAPGFRERLAATGATAPAMELSHYLGSAHRALSCVDCHPGTTMGPHASTPAVRQCTDCHRPEGAAGGYHAAPLVTQLHTGATAQSPHCEDCHGHHGVGRPDDPDSPTYWNNVPRLCGSCHVAPERAEQVPQVPGYFQSIHGKIAAGGTVARPAVCTDCHLLHKVEGQAPKTPGQANIVPPRRVRPSICARCHPNQDREYEASVHGEAVRRGDADAAVCTDCHGEHNIEPPTEAESTVAPTRVVQTCSRCHGSIAFTRLHSLPAAPVLTYGESYHGVANKYGDIAVANCTSCHGTHDILPARSPRSSVNPSRLAETCGKCHPGAGTSFPIGRIHVGPRVGSDVLMLILQVLYILIILGSLVAFLAYIALDLFVHWRLKEAGELEKVEHRVMHLPSAPESALIRMFPAERLQHFLLLSSFFILAITGLVLLIPDTTVGKTIIALCGGPSGRAIIHRVAAGVMMANFLFQGLYLAFTARGRDKVRRLAPAASDVRDVYQTVLLFLGFTHHRPSFRRYGFPEKFEFWALVWGTIVMSVTGLMLVFATWSLGHFPKWLLDAATIVHKWEAVLAVEAIIIWHMYHAVWKPGVFPGNKAWLTGKIDFEALVLEHPLDYAEAVGWLRRAGETPPEPEAAAEPAPEPTPEPPAETPPESE